MNKASLANLVNMKANRYIPDLTPGDTVRVSTKVNRRR